MPKVTRPLFSDSAAGRIGNVGSFRMSPTGAQFIRQAKPKDAKTPAQLKVRACFKAARAAWMKINKNYRPDWGGYWRNWLATHPDCTS